MNPMFYRPLEGVGCCLGAPDSAVCDQALVDARANRPGWSPNDSFGLTCFDPFLTSAQKVACACAGKLTFTEEITKLAKQIEDRISPKPHDQGGGGGGGDNSQTPADSGGGAGALVGAGLLAWLFWGK